MPRRRRPQLLSGPAFDKLLIAAGYPVPKRRAARLGKVEAETLRAQIMAEDDDEAAPPREARVTINGVAVKTSTKRLGGPITLNTRMLRMIELMVRGHDHDPSHTPVDPYEAGRVVGYQRRAVRELTKSAIFRRAYDEAQRGVDPGRRVPTFEHLSVDVERRERLRAARSRAPGLVIRLPPGRNPDSAGAKK